MKHNLLKSVIISVILLMGVSNAWAEKGFFDEGQWNIQYWDGHSDKWGSNASGYNNESSLDLGIQTTLYLTKGWVKTWSNDSWTQSEVIWYWGWTSGSTTNNWKAYKSSLQGNLTWEFDLATNDYDLIGNAPNNPGHNTLYMYWRLDNYVSSLTSTVTFTIPGFTSTSASKTFGNTTVGSNSSQTISFGTHYGQALTTSNCTITGTNKSEFSVTSISESGVTVKFAPTTAGNKSATLTIKDAHGKTCTITLNGKTQYTVTYSKGNNQTAYKVYGTNLTLKDEGHFTRIGYKQIAWNTNPDGTSGITYALGATYTKEVALTLYPTWEAQPATTIYLEPTGYWNSHSPQYVARVWKNSVHEDIIMTGVGDSPYRYYKAEVPYGYTNVVFYRKSTNGTTIWNQTANLQLPTNDYVLYTITSTGTNNSGQQDYQAAGGYWKVANLVYTVTLAGTLYGSYDVTYNSNTYSVSSDDMTINDVPLNSQLTITDIHPNAGYDQTMVYSTDGANYTEFGPEKTLTVTANTIIGEDFRTTEEHDIYLKIPNLPFKYWCNNDENAHPRILFMHGTNGQDAEHEQNAREFELISTNTSYRIYKITAPEGYHSFFIYSSHEFTASKVFNHEIIHTDPTDNCYELTNEEVTKVKNVPSTEGRWVSAKVSLEPCNIGTYGIIYNNVEYLNDATNETVIEMPYGSSIQIIDATPTSPHYMANPRYKTSIVRKWYLTEFEKDQTIEVVDDYNFAPNLVTKESHRVYLRIPNNLRSDWNKNSNGEYFNCIYLRDYLSNWRTKHPSNDNPEIQYGMVVKSNSHETFEADEDELWYIDIPAGYHTFVFERKDNVEQGTGFTAQGETFYYGIPTDGENICYTVNHDNPNPDDLRLFEGTWGPLPTCTITAHNTHVGRYGIKYNDETHYATREHTETFEVPYGAQVEVVYGDPGDNTYNGNVIMYEGDSNTDTEREFTSSENVTITKHRWFDDNFKAIEAEIVYLGIPSSILEKWTSCNNPDHTPGGKVQPYIYDNQSNLISYESNPITYEGTTYYKFTVPQGFKNFQFQAKNSLNTEWANLCAQTAEQWYPPLEHTNCFMLDGLKDGNNYTGHWEQLNLPEVGDYRLLYVEQVVEKSTDSGDECKTVITRKKAHPSDLIKANEITEEEGKTVSLHTYKDRIYTASLGNGETYESSNNPEIILQRYDGNNWIDKEWHMVYGPLETLPIMSNLPGRKNASPSSNIDDLQHHNGIKIIKQDVVNHPDQGNGVWNFVIKQKVGAPDGDEATIDLKRTHRYTGTYYIRTNAADGSWHNYTIPANHMTFSSYSKTYRSFSHYFCKWILSGNNVGFTIANDHGLAISDTLYKDDLVTTGILPEPANVRFSWNMVNNEIARAYIRGTWTTNEPPARIWNIVVDYTPSEGANHVQKYLDDTGDWIYSRDIDVNVGSQLVSLTAQYPSEGIVQTFAEDINMLVGDYDNKKSYKVRILYDFKIDKTLVALVPNENEATVGIDVLIERIDQNPATQVQVPITAARTEGSTVYAVMTFNKGTLTDEDLSDQRRFTYWISFPFDVNIADVFGFSEYGKQWRIRTYDSQARAENGYDGTQTYWKYIDINQTPVLEANKGYILVLNAKLRNEDHSAYTNRSSLSLYFPSASTIKNINTGYTETEVEVPQYESENTPYKDWNWNMIGVPSYADKNKTIEARHLYYFFDYNLDDDSYEVCWTGKEQTFKSMFAYMVQFEGIIDWTEFSISPSQLTIRKDASMMKNHVLCLHLQHNGEREDRTYIQLTEDEKATELFDMNLDLTKMTNANANIYTLIGNHQLAANVLPIEETIIPIGIKTDAAGEYTFAMPDGTDGIVVELIDYENNTRTNMLLDNYTVTLGKGTFESRFALHVKPDKTTTSVDNLGNEATGDKVKKYLIDGVLYMQKDGVLYDAQGRCVQ